MCPALGQLSPPAHCCNHEGIVEIGDDPRHPTVKLFIHSHPRTLPSPIFTILVFSNCDFNYTFTMDIQKRHLSALSPCLRLPTPNEGFANKWPASQWQHLSMREKVLEGFPSIYCKYLSIIVNCTSMSELKNSIHMLSVGWAPLAHSLLNEYHPSFLVYIFLSKLHTLRTHCTHTRKRILDSFIVTTIEYYFFKYI